MEAREIWGATMSTTRAWAMMCRDFFDDEKKTRELIYRHLAWITALRYQLRAPRTWENIEKSYNKEYTRHYSIPERETPLEQELLKYISETEVKTILPAANKATQLMSIQSDILKRYHGQGSMDEFRFLVMHSVLKEFVHHQGRSERIKNFPYPRQYVTINGMFVRLFCILLPFGLLEEFDKLNERVAGFLHGNMVWLVVPFSVLISWVFTSLEQVGESAENPFEGNPNDVPISQMSRAVEIDVRQMLKEVNLPTPLQPQNEIVM